jgi:hypothetical protein
MGIVYFHADKFASDVFAMLIAGYNKSRGAGRLPLVEDLPLYVNNRFSTFS